MFGFVWRRLFLCLGLVAPLVARNSAVHRSSRFAVSSPNRTTKPESIPTRLMTTWTKVKVANRCAFRRQMFGNGSANAFGCAGDDGDFARELFGLRAHGFERLGL